MTSDEARELLLRDYLTFQRRHSRLAAEELYEAHRVIIDENDALAAEVRRLRGELQDERLSLAPLREAHAEALNAAAQNEAALAALRQRHAEAVKSAYIEGRNSDEFDAADKFIEDEYSWLASEARRQLEEGR